jgi:glycerate 2-kinase
VRVLVAPDRFGSVLTASQSAEALARGWLSQAPDDELDLCPMSDGGTGFVDAVAAGTDPGAAQLVPVTVTGPLGAPTAATLLLVTASDGVPCAYLEASQAVGPHLVAAGQRDRSRTSSVGVGELLEAAVEAGARRVVVGCGPAVSHDGGAGLLAALGAGPAELLAQGAGRLAQLPDGALSRLPDVRGRLEGVELVAATDSVLPLLGFHGLSAMVAQASVAAIPEPHAAPESSEVAQQLENALGRFADVAQRSLVAGRPLSGRGYAGEPGSGCGGGVALALLLLGARRVSGASAVMDVVGLAGRLPGTDVLLTSEQLFDRASLGEHVVAGVAEAATARGIPTVVIAGLVELGRREALAAGVAGAYALAERPVDLPTTAEAADAALAARARRTARTWSR